MRAERSAILLRRVTCEAAGPAWTCPPEAARATQEVLLDDSAPGSPPGPARRHPAGAPVSAGPHGRGRPWSSAVLASHTCLSPPRGRRRPFRSRATYENLPLDPQTAGQGDSIAGRLRHSRTFQSEPLRWGESLRLCEGPPD